MHVVRHVRRDEQAFYKTLRMFKATTIEHLHAQKCTRINTSPRQSGPMHGPFQPTAPGALKSTCEMLGSRCPGALTHGCLAPSQCGPILLWSPWTDTCGNLRITTVWNLCVLAEYVVLNLYSLEWLLLLCIVSACVCKRVRVAATSMAPG